MRYEFLVPEEGKVAGEWREGGDGEGGVVISLLSSVLS
jgi:hypothetical protein